MIVMEEWMRAHSLEVSFLAGLLLFAICRLIYSLWLCGIRATVSASPRELWVGAKWDRRSRTLLVQPVPCLGVLVYRGW